MRFVTVLKAIILFIFYWAAGPSVFAQQTNLQFKHLTPNEGLTQGVINNIFTDSRGFVWMTGLDGINRFDGTQCLANKEIAPGLIGVAATWGIVEDYNGDIWFGYTDGLIKYNYRQNVFTIIQLKKLQPILAKNIGQTYTPAFVDDDNSVLVGTSDWQFFIYHPVLNKITELPKFVEANHGLFLKTKNKGFTNNLYLNYQIKDTFFLYRYEIDKKGKPFWQLKTSGYGFNAISSVAIQDDSTLIILAKNQIAKFCFTTNLFQIKTFPNVDNPGAVIDINKNIWVGTLNEGLYAVDGKTLAIKAHYQNEPNNPGSIMGNESGPYCDRLGNLWVADKFNGVDYCNLADTKFISSFSQQQSTAVGSSSFIRSIVEDNQGNFYCGTNDHAVVVLDKNLHFVKNLPDITGELACPGMLLQGQSIYIGADFDSDPFLYKYNLTNHTVKKIKNKYDNDNSRVYQLSNMANGDLLAATYNGLWKINTTTDAFEKLPGITEEYRTVVFSYEDRHGQIYKGINYGGLSIYKPDVSGYKKVFELEKKLTVKHVAEINDSLMWIGTSDGLYLFNTQTFAIKKHYTTGNGLSNNVVYAIMPDATGNLWLSTNKGLSYFYVATEIFKHFTIEDGLQSNEFNTHTVIRTKDGRIIFGGVNGLTTIDPAMLNKKSISPVVLLTAIKADSSMNPFSFDEKNILQLPAGSNAIEFEITAIDFINPTKCKIQYRLSGYGNEWTVASNPGIARYIKLPAGNYVLEYRASNAEGIFNNDIKHFNFTIAAYWWQTWLFKIACILLGIVITIVLIRRYVKNKLRRQQQLLEKSIAITQERERITADLHDDVGATLSSMHIYGDLANTVWDTQPQQSKDMVGKISLQSKELMNRMSDIVWSLKPPGEEKNSFTGRLRNYTHDLLTGKNIAAVFTIDEALTTKIINPLARKNILLIAKEAINNIAKYSQATEATIAFNQQGKDAVLTISDNGKGFEKSLVSNGNGLGNIEQRCKQLNGSCIIETSEGNGVVITCSFSIAIISHTG